MTNSGLNGARRTTNDLQSSKNSHAMTEHEHRLFHHCTLPAASALAELSTSPNGLTTDEATQRLDDYGPNELPRAKRVGFWGDMFQRLKSPLVIQLLVISLISGLMGDLKSATIVAAMIVLSVGLSYVLDRRSNHAVEALGKRVQSRTVVLRDGKEVEARISKVVPGDIVLLYAGSVIPADLRLLSAKDFFVGQSALTGESMAVEKQPDAPPPPNCSVMELPNACFLGSTVTSGTGRAVVVNTGARTLFGSLSERLAQRAEGTSFDRGVSSFTWLMIRFMLVMVSAVFLIVGMTKG
ncbi:MAG TPA: cation-transporting P-type ATPase, partial [Candidatus Methylomirabilis sp.]|nr:cation-transporting P-type ATPase [Candidatus Methylomirabilis sp.]